MREQRKGFFFSLAFVRYGLFSSPLAFLYSFSFGLLIYLFIIINTGPACSTERQSPEKKISSPFSFPPNYHGIQRKRKEKKKALLPVLRRSPLWRRRACNVLQTTLRLCISFHVDWLGQTRRAIHKPGTVSVRVVLFVGWLGWYQQVLWTEAEARAYVCVCVFLRWREHW